MDVVKNSKLGDCVGKRMASNKVRMSSDHKIPGVFAPENKWL